jgi:hypothetical protein
LFEFSHIPNEIEPFEEYGFIDLVRQLDIRYHTDLSMPMRDVSALMKQYLRGDSSMTSIPAAIPFNVWLYQELPRRSKGLRVLVGGGVSGGGARSKLEGSSSRLC